MSSGSLHTQNQQGILTPDQRLRVFVSSTLQELAQERQAAREAVLALHLTPVMFELGARPHPPRELYRAYLEQSHIFIGIYGKRYGWTAPGESVSGLEDEFRLAGKRPKLIYIKKAVEREPGLVNLLDHIRQDAHVSYKSFETAAELRPLIENDLALLLSEQLASKFKRESGEETNAATLKGALPVPTTPLVGREAELAELGELLLRDEVRLITLTGPGGIGKSRLAVELARRLRDNFRDGARFVGLSHIRASSLVADTIARTIGVVEVSGRPAIDSLKIAVGDKQLLLVLDNFEQILPAAPLVTELLSVAAGLKILATSRTSLHLSGEWEYPVPSLKLPPTESSTLPDRVADADSVRLFMARAKAVKPDFSLTSENAPAVADITRRLDGLPLAIELAAARMRLLSPQGLLARLGNRLEILTDGPRDLPPRQQTLRQTLDWSYKLLTPDEQRLFNYLGVFVGGFDLEAIESIVPIKQGTNLLDLLYSLMEKSLVKERGTMRFMLLETLREYSLEKLGRGTESLAIRRKHAAYYLAFAEQTAEVLHGSDQHDWLAQLELDHANLRAAIEWEEAQGNLASVARFGWALWFFWYVRGYTSEGLAWMEQALAKAPPPPVRGRLLLVAGIMLNRQGEHERSLELVDECLPLFRDQADREGEGLALTMRGYAAAALRQLDLARSALEESLALYRALGKQWMIAYVFASLGRLAASLGEYDEALALAGEALACQQQDGDPSIAAYALGAMGAIRLLRSESQDAATHFHRSLELARRSENPNLLAASLEGLAGVAVLEARFERAARLWGAAGWLRQTLSVPMLPLERALYEPLIASARERLGEAAFAKELAKGKALTREGAVDYAISESDEELAHAQAPTREPKRSRPF